MVSLLTTTQHVLHGLSSNASKNITIMDDTTVLVLVVLIIRSHDQKSTTRQNFIVISWWLMDCSHGERNIRGRQILPECTRVVQDVNHRRLNNPFDPDWSSVLTRRTTTCLVHKWRNNIIRLGIIVLCHQNLLLFMICTRVVVVGSLRVETSDGETNEKCWILLIINELSRTSSTSSWGERRKHAQQLSYSGPCLVTFGTCCGDQVVYKIGFEERHSGGRFEKKK